jgi:hypothetical protein
VLLGAELPLPPAAAGVLLGAELPLPPVAAGVLLGAELPLPQLAAPPVAVLVLLFIAKPITPTCTQS